MINDKFVQLSGPFVKDIDVLEIIRENYPDFHYIKKIGIQCKSTHLCKINGQTFEIGKTEILEISDVRITSVSFFQDEPQDTLIDCIIG